MPPGPETAPSPAMLHAQQVAAWSGEVGQMWAANDARTEAGLAPVSEALLARAAPVSGEVVLDVGCGGGSTTQALAEAVGADGRVVGLDVSPPILAVARARLAGLGQVTLVEGDAAVWQAPDLRADLLFSRFGVMFFGDPVAAFANLRTMLRPGGRVAFACWRPVADNPWVLLPLQAIRGIVPPLPRPGPEDPGQFAFGDSARVTRIVEGAGFTKPEFEVFDFAFRFPADPKAAAARAAYSGPAGRALRDQPEEVCQAAEAAVAAALAPLSGGDGIVLGASVWLVTCRNP